MRFRDPVEEVISSSVKTVIFFKEFVESCIIPRVDLNKSVEILMGENDNVMAVTECGNGWELIAVDCVWCLRHHT